MRRRVRVALAGCGVVGGELVRLLRARGDSIEREYGLRFELSRVLVRRPELARPVDLAAGVITGDVEAFLRADAEVVVEAIGGVEPALRIARSALERGARFITANKAVLAASAHDLMAVALGEDGLWFDAAVGGGVPVVRVIRDLLGRAPIRRVRGILNGTCNFVLTRLESGSSFPVALAEAQRCGFAEADATRDLDGRDAADKIAIVAWLAFGSPPTAVRVRRRGLLPDPRRLTAGAAAAGGRLRQLAECERTSDGVLASVEPVVVAPDSPFARTLDEENRVQIDAGWSAPLELAGPGAGGGPTAAALLADLLQASGARSATGGLLNGAGRAVHARVDWGAHTWLVGVPGMRSRAARDALEAASIPAAAVGASLGDTWIAAGPAPWPVLEAVIHGLDSRGEPVAIARLDDTRAAPEAGCRIMAAAGLPVAWTGA